MKKVISAILCTILIFALLSGCGNQVYEKISSKNILGQGTTENNTDNTDFKLYLENDYLQLYINPDTTEIKTVNKADNSEWLSTGAETAGDAARALIQLTYIDSTGQTGELNSYENAVRDGQYEITEGDGRVTLKYSIGSFSSQVLIPEVITEERYKQLCDSFEDEFALMKFQNYYYHFNKDEIENEELKNQYISKYPILKTKSMYVINDSVLNSPTVKKEFADVLKQCSYTEEMYREDSKNFKNTSDSVKEAGCNISIELSLDGSTLKVYVPNKRIEMYSDYLITNIALLKYFGAPKANEKGYFLLPDGSGSVMSFYNGKTDGHEYSAAVYGTGYSLSGREKTSNYYDASLPIFGINKGETAVFAEITKGDGAADIKAYSGDERIAPFVSPRFRFRETYTAQLSSGKKENFITVQKQRYAGDMEVDYHFLTGKNAGYCGMAQFYADKLFGDTDKKTDKINVVLEYIGMLDKKAQLFGISHNKKIVTSSFEDIENEVNALYDSGLNNINVRLSGWFSSGYSHGSLKNLSAQKRLGGEKGLDSLRKKLDGLGAVLWYDADVQYMKVSGLNSNTGAIKTISKAVGTTCSYDPATFLQVKSVYERRVNNISAVTAEIEYLSKWAGKNKAYGVSLRSIGKSVNANYDENAFCDNGATVEKTEKALKTLTEGGTRLMTAGSNKYVLNTADICLDTPLISNRYDSTDMSVPFLQIVLRGRVSFAGAAVNLSGNSSEAILQAAQTGADIYYIFTCENSDELTDSNYNAFYSTDSSAHKDELTGMVAKYQSDLAETAGKKITGFSYITENVTKTDFENGICVYVNFGNTDYTADGIKIPAKSYTAVKE